VESISELIKVVDKGAAVGGSKPCTVDGFKDPHCILYIKVWILYIANCLVSSSIDRRLVEMLK